MTKSNWKMNKYMVCLLDRQEKKNAFNRFCVHLHNEIDIISAWDMGILFGVENTAVNKIKHAIQPG